MWDDEISGSIKVSTNDKNIISKMVIMKSDGMPVYHFCSCVDDIDMETSVISRGIDHMANTARQVALMHHINLVLGRSLLPKFQHVGLIFRKKRKCQREMGIRLCKNI